MRIIPSTPAIDPAVMVKNTFTSLLFFGLLLTCVASVRVNTENWSWVREVQSFAGKGVQFSLGLNRVGKSSKVNFFFFFKIPDLSHITIWQTQDSQKTNLQLRIKSSPHYCKTPIFLSSTSKWPTRSFPPQPKHSSAMRKYQVDALSLEPLPLLPKSSRRSTTMIQTIWKPLRKVRFLGSRTCQTSSQQIWQGSNQDVGGSPIIYFQMDPKRDGLHAVRERERYDDKRNHRRGQDIRNQHSPPRRQAILGSAGNCANAGRRFTAKGLIWRLWEPLSGLEFGCCLRCAVCAQAA
jgi:hypothetical protein